MALNQYTQNEKCFEYLGMNCWQDEDFIGKVARISRRCSNTTCAIRTIRLSLLFYHKQWRKEFG